MRARRRQVAISAVLLDEDGIWLKGKSTFEPFSSIVPKHLISLEGEESTRLRGTAQRCLGEHLRPRLLKVASAAASRLASSLERPVGQAAAEIGPQFDALVRQTALEIISEGLFGAGEGWRAAEAGNAVSDSCSCGNRSRPLLAKALSGMMHELHWRLTDLTAREWRTDRLASVRAFVAS